ncbi:hypothetical protein BD410DRAFT_724625 [Rickenella mellea]|uniref:Prolyl 4-hydroxylase alpha subunit Fe(2+) 2OG dioxygenase domain-containing protein n=1 Tax=Rickenella mellea TaxID=50990 RepID=A0A4Y7Q244_9AGAM|nr:hypothetical protein BD410DRAFT_724625 [Rickenella mellea]
MFVIPIASLAQYLTNSSTACPLVDRDNRVFGVLAGRPGIPTWEADVTRPAYQAIAKAKNQCKFKKTQKYHRRGRFPVEATGISYGGGQAKPQRLTVGQSGVNESTMSALVESTPMMRIAGYANTAMRTWAPRLYQRYLRNMDAIRTNDPSLQPIFDNSVFASATVNFGPNVACFPHVDDHNLAHGWCAITALGEFDPTQGGHLVLWDLNLIIEFPAGSTILIPSATLRHSNIPTRDGEMRASFTTYSAGGLFRWVAYGHQSQEDFEREDPEGWRAMEANREERGQEAVGDYSTLSELGIKGGKCGEGKTKE